MWESPFLPGTLTSPFMPPRLLASSLPPSPDTPGPWAPLFPESTCGDTTRLPHSLPWWVVLDFPVHHRPRRKQRSQGQFSTAKRTLVCSACWGFPSPLQSSVGPQPATLLPVKYLEERLLCFHQKPSEGRPARGSTTWPLKKPPQLWY